MMAAIGILSTVFLAVSTGYGIVDAISSGSWKNWGVLTWLANIASVLCILFPYFRAFKAVSKAHTALGGGIMRLLEKVPLLGQLVTRCGWIFDGLRKYWYMTMAVFYTKDSWLHKFGKGFAEFAKLVGKHPWVAVGLVFASSMFDGILQRIFQLWGDLSLKAAGFAYERLSVIMNDEGYGDPVSQAVSMMDDASNSLPECFTAIWGAVGASECIGLIIVTFQYIILLACLSSGFKTAGVK